MKKLLFILSTIATLFSSMNAEAQCCRTSAFGSATASATCGSTVSITSCQYATERATLNSIVAGRTYRVNSSITTDWVTVRSGSTSCTAPVVYFGPQGGNWVATVSGTYYAHFSTNSSCGSSTACRATSITTVSGCGVVPPSSGCNNTISYGSAVVPSDNVTINTVSCAYAGEYSTWSGAVSGQTLRFTSTVASDYITVRAASPGGTVIAQGTQPLQFTNNYTGTIYVHVNTNSSCGTANSCRNVSGQCISCSAPVTNPCTSIATISSCGTNVTASMSGTGVWNVTNCGYTTPGQEKIFQFTPATSGTYVLNVTSISGGYIDFFWKAASGGCNATGWNCIDDIISTGTYAGLTSMTLTAGTTYYILLDPEGTGSYSATFNIGCPAPPYNACANITNIASCGSTSNVNIPLGAGAWSSYGGPYTTPGNEQLFTFTPAITGSYPITVTNNGSGWIDLFFKASASGCNNSGWTYVDDVAGTATNNVTLTAGVTYYLMLDDEDISGSTGSISIGCPCIGTAVDASYTYTNSAITISGNTAGGCDDSPLRAGDDRIYAINISCPGSYTFSLCGGASWDTYLTLSSASGSGLLASNDDACSLQSSITYTVASAGTYYIAVEPYSSGSTGAFTLNISGSGAAPVLTGAVSNVTCNGSSNGSINVTTGSSTSTTYSWSNGATTEDISGVAAGSYTLTATNCWGTSTATFNVTQPAPIVVTASSNVPNNTVCFEGDATLSATATGDGTLDYGWEAYDDASGQWSPYGITQGGSPVSETLELVALTATGMYRFVVSSATDASCTANAEIMVVVADDPVLSVTSGNVLCNGGNDGSASASLSGGVSPSYDYAWSNGETTTDISGLTAGTYSVTATGLYGCNAAADVTITEPTALVVSNVTSDYNGYGVSCNGSSDGSVTVSATGGTAPYTGDGANTGLSAGTYSYIVTDANGCTATTSATISEPDALSLTLTKSDYNGFNISCFGFADGSISANVSGGVQAYSYNWNNGATTDVNGGLTAGAYDVTVTDANGCQISASTTMFEPTKLEIDATSTAILCNGGSSTVVVTTSGGVSPYVVDDAGTYTVPAGTYTYNVVDLNACANSITVDITQPTLLTVNAGGDEVVYIGYGPMTCANLDADAQGGTPAYNVMWTSLYSGGGMGETLTACPTQNDVFTVTVIDANGCTATDELSICVVDVICYAGSSSIQKVEMCQVPPGNPNNAHTICVDENAVPAHLAIGCYLGACNEAATICAAVSSKPSVAAVTTEAQAALSVYPNPTENTTTVSLTMSKAGEYAVELFNMMGQKVATIYTGSFGEFENQTFEMNMRSLENGIYMVGVSNGGRMIETIKVVKN